jgi:hypothetical protein
MRKYIRSPGEVRTHDPIFRRQKKEEHPADITATATASTTVLINNL